jgi:hypothetical protein
MASAVATLGLVWFAILKMEPSLVAEKLSLDRTLYIFPVLILAEFYWFMNDLIAYLSKKHGVLLDLGFSEIRFTYDLDVQNTAISFGVSIWECIRLRLRCCCSVPR